MFTALGMNHLLCLFAAPTQSPSAASSQHASAEGELIGHYTGTIRWTSEASKQITSFTGLLLMLPDHIPF